MILPIKSHFLTEAAHYNLIPLSLEVRTDFDTPVSLFQKVKGKFLLESVEQNGQIGRHSIIALGEIAKFEMNQTSIAVTLKNADGSTFSETVELKNPLERVRDYFKQIKLLAGPELGGFSGGAIGYLGYETVCYFEDLSFPKATSGIPDGILVVPQTLIVYDNLKRSCRVIDMCRPGKHHAEAYEHSVERLIQIKDLLEGPLFTPKVEAFVDAKLEIEKLVDKETFKKNVLKVKEEIAAGEIFQALPSQPFRIQTQAPAFEIYRSLRILNPSPYLYFLDFGSFQIVGSSPEVMVKVNQGELLLKPIAGTRKRGDNDLEDKRLAEELLADPKELAEHLMLVDLGRNDLGRVAVPGTVEVYDYMAVEKYSHVMHIVTSIRATLKKSADAFDVIKATFPAGTLTGAPKIRAMEILSKLENRRRGAYGGMVLHLGFNGDLDSCITIRTGIVKDGAVTIQAGAGVVADSDPEKEYEECVNKAKALVMAVTDCRERNKPEEAL